MIEADYSAALTLLLRYPESSTSQDAKSFVTDAIFLKTHFHSDGGSHIVHKYTGRHLPLVSQAGTVSTSPEVPIFKVAERSRFPPSTLMHSSQPARLENLLQDAARGVFKRGEKWGVNQAVRDAVGEVRRNVQSLQAGSGSPRGKSAESPKPSTDPDNLLRKISKLEERNKALAKILEGAVAELWGHQKTITEDELSEGGSVNALSMAIARVQFVQVYLEDSSMTLPKEDAAKEETRGTASAEPQSTESNSGHDLEHAELNPENAVGSQGEESEPERTLQSQSAPDRTPSSANARARPKQVITAYHESPSIAQQPPATAPSTQASFSQSPSKSPSTSTNLNLPRPSLAQSSFSWMLGDGSRRNNSFVSASPFPAEKRRHAGNGKADFLFGDEDGFEGAKTRGGSKSGSKSGKGEAGEQSEVFDLGEMDESGR